ncbi:MAG: chromosomal replication initiator protein DnaA [Lachnospiraceae bacterium]|nr:chromosomal replication initiator protein DnaA [Lachnospiraceae bacterium]
MINLEKEFDSIKNTVKKEFELTDIAYNIWIAPLKYVSFENNVVTIMVPDEHSQILDHISKKYKVYFQSVISELLDNIVNINFVVQQEETKEENQSMPVQSQRDDDYFKAANLNKKYSFENFVVGSNNDMAQRACLAVADCVCNGNSNDEGINPLFIYGGSGLGKTHLMNSIGHYIVKNKPNKKVLYVSSEEFTNEVIESIRGGNSTVSHMTKLREKYRNIDVLLIDDIQFIIGKNSTQEEFFHTFNTLYEAGKTIVISSDKHPKEMVTLDERFRSRFQMGLITDIQPPVYETRMAILQKYVENLGRPINNDILMYIAENIKSNVRELEGAVNKVIAIGRLNPSTEMTLETAKDALKDTIFPDSNTIITPGNILDAVAEYFHIKTEDIISKKRSQDLVLPRHIFMYLCREMTDTTLKGIAIILERDHSTVKHGVDKIGDEMRTNQELKDTVEIIRKKISK